MKTAVCVILCNPTYKESFENANGELYEEMKDKSIDLFSSTKGVTEHKVSNYLLNLISVFMCKFCML